VVQVPAGLRRLVRPLGGDGNTYVLLEEIIRAEMATLFAGQNILEVSAFRVRATRRWSWTRRAGETTWKPSRTSCASGA
jgi:polyphosphate kinase